MTLTETAIPSLACVITCRQVTPECLHRKNFKRRFIMEKYLEADLEIVQFPAEDIIATSSQIPTEDDELPWVPV
jgi:hypothetical protein